MNLERIKFKSKFSRMLAQIAVISIFLLASCGFGTVFPQNFVPIFGADFVQAATKEELQQQLQQIEQQIAQYQSQLAQTRSEEHTSELQSPDHLVCRLLLEK